MSSEERKLSQLSVAAELAQFESAYFTYIERCGTLERSRWEYGRGSVVEFSGCRFLVLALEAQPRYLDGGASPFTVQLRCRPLPLSPNKSVEIVRSVLNELSDRAGFDSWWREIDTNTRNDLEDTLKLKVNAQLEAH